MMPRVMISYRNIPAESAFAKELNDAFEAAGVDTWLDIKDIPPMVKWEDAIVEGIRKCDYVVVCLSEAYYQSDVCMMECYLARGYRKKILPVNVSQNPAFDLWQELPQYEETKGLEDVAYANIYVKEFFGLNLTKYERLQRIVDAVANPLPPETHYDIYISYRNREAEFASRVADDLNRAGLSTFVTARQLYIGDDWRAGAWNAMLQAKYHLVILTPDIVDSRYIRNELRITRTKKETVFIPILAESLVNDQQAQDDMLKTFTNKEFALLNSYQWLKPDMGYAPMIQTLIDYLRKELVSS